MPVHLGISNRRQFLNFAGVTVCTLALTRTTDADSCPQSDLVYILNDTHIGEKHPTDSPVPTHLRQAVNELVQLPNKPAAVLINGDLALKDGQPGDYRHFGKLIHPLRKAEIPTHLTMGNHDNRETFLKVLSEWKRTDQPLESRYVSIVKTRFANFFLLDSLQKTMVTQGTLGVHQLTWLKNALDHCCDRPAIIVLHHNPRLGGDPIHYPGGLTDTTELWNIIRPRTWVKALVHGHVHDRSFAQQDGIHIINTPATSYVADRTKSTTGWTVARLTRDSISLETRTTDPEHPWNGQTRLLCWRPDNSLNQPTCSERRLLRIKRFRASFSGIRRHH